MSIRHDEEHRSTLSTTLSLFQLSDLCVISDFFDVLRFCQDPIDIFISRS
jgi:hypothetical protein